MLSMSEYRRMGVLYTILSFVLEVNWARGSGVISAETSAMAKRLFALSEFLPN
jgi:hypothetical protein